VRKISEENPKSRLVSDVVSEPTVGESKRAKALSERRLPPRYAIMGISHRIEKRGSLIARLERRMTRAAPGIMWTPSQGIQGSRKPASIVAAARRFALGRQTRSVRETPNANKMHSRSNVDEAITTGSRARMQASLCVADELLSIRCGRVRH
jgi:hypothetical protein